VGLYHDYRRSGPSGYAPPVTDTVERVTSRLGAVLILDSPDTAAARRIAETLPLHRAGLIQTEIIQLHPFDLR
jgi:hypothetical protein